jgi:hypothetical protein
MLDWPRSSAFLRAGAVFERAGAREPMIEACGGRSPRGGSECMRLSSPHGRLSGRAGRWLHSSLRLSPARLAGGMGRVRVRAGRGVPLALAGGRMSGGLAAGGGRAPGCGTRRVTRLPSAACQGCGCARRACCSRPG